MLYCALGHYHQQRPVTNPLDSTQVWYSGIPEGRAWDEEGTCGYLLGEIAGGVVSVKSCPSSQYPLVTLTLDCDGYTSREQVLDAILRQRHCAFNENTILRVRLEGALDPKLDLSIPEMEERLAGDMLHIAWDDRTVPAVDFDALARERTLCGYFVRTLNQQIHSAQTAERPALERARLYGVQALLGREVRVR